MAQKGSELGNFLAGALAKSDAVDFSIFPGPAGSLLRRVEGNLGLRGGFWGVGKVERRFAQFPDGLTARFQQQGVAAGITRVQTDASPDERLPSSRPPRSARSRRG